MLIDKIDVQNLKGPFDSRRGKYYWYEDCDFNVSREELRKYIDSFDGIGRILDLCKREYLLFKNKYIDALHKTHPFWIGEDRYLLEAYANLYSDMHNTFQNRKLYSKNCFVANTETRISSFQILDTKLIIYQRSCDLSLEYLADLITILLIMDDYNLEYVSWLCGCAHIYENNLTNTVKQFNLKVKMKMNFNKRKG